MFFFKFSNKRLSPRTGELHVGEVRFAIRAAQVDYLRTQFSSTDALSTGLFGNTNGRQNNFRYSAGIVFRF
jgi:hypothetical protein